MLIEPEGHIHHIYIRNLAQDKLIKYGASTKVLQTYNLFTDEGLETFLSIAEPYNDYVDDTVLAFAYALQANKKHDTQ